MNWQIEMEEYQLERLLRKNEEALLGALDEDGPY